MSVTQLPSQDGLYSAQLQNCTWSYASQAGHLQLLATRKRLPSLSSRSTALHSEWPSFQELTSFIGLSFLGFFYVCFWQLFLFSVRHSVGETLRSRKEQVGFLGSCVCLCFGSGLNMCFSNMMSSWLLNIPQILFAKSSSKDSKIFLFYLLWNFALRFSYKEEIKRLAFWIQHTTRGRS